MVARAISEVRYAAVRREVRCGTQRGMLQLWQSSLGLSTRFAVTHEVAALREVVRLARFAVALYEYATQQDCSTQRGCCIGELFGSLLGEGIHASAYSVEPPIVVVPKNRAGLLFIST